MGTRYRAKQVTYAMTREKPGAVDRLHSLCGERSWPGQHCGLTSMVSLGSVTGLISVVCRRTGYANRSRRVDGHVRRRRVPDGVANGTALLDLQSQRIEGCLVSVGFDGNSHGNLLVARSDVVCGTEEFS